MLSIRWAKVLDFVIVSSHTCTRNIYKTVASALSVGTEDGLPGCWTAPSVIRTPTDLRLCLGAQLRVKNTPSKQTKGKEEQNKKKCQPGSSARVSTGYHLLFHGSHAGSHGVQSQNLEHKSGPDTGQAVTKAIICVICENGTTSET